jgi:hypothetical protein
VGRIIFKIAKIVAAVDDRGLRESDVNDVGYKRWLLKNLYFIYGIKIIDANKTLIEMFEGKIKSKIAEVWGE